MTGILTRIHLVKKDGQEIAYLYKAGLMKLSNPEHPNNPAQTINIGSIIEVGDTKYRVCEIQTTVYSTTLDMGNVGFNRWGIGEILPFNFELIYVVEEV